MPFSCPGGVPYDILKPVLERCTAEQLYQLEHYNPYLMEETGPHWQFHCNRDFRGQKLQEYETWRELYLVRINQGDNFYQWRILLRTERAKFVESNLKRRKKKKILKMEPLWTTYTCAEERVGEVRQFCWNLRLSKCPLP